MKSRSRALAGHQTLAAVTPLVACLLLLFGCAGLGEPTSAPPPATVEVPSTPQVESWVGPVTEYRLSATGIYYRVFGGGAVRIGAWVSPTVPRSRAEARATLALPPENTATHYAMVIVPSGTLVRSGTAAPAFAQPGGGRQVELLERIPTESFSAPIPLSE